MKPEFQIIPDKREKSFLARKLYRKSGRPLSQVWHYHPEIEICLTHQGGGKRFVGNTISDYDNTDLVMFGSNLPHGFLTNKKCVQTVILFGQDFLGDNFFDKPELKKVKNLIGRAKNGLQFKYETQKKARKVIKKILSHEGLTKTIYFLELLNLLSNSVYADHICKKEYSLDLKTTNLDRIKLVYNYIMENYKKDISVKEMANLVNLTEASFFKFMKRHTERTFTQIINEFRINHASKLLMTTDQNVSEICFECGYNNISYFNRKFKEIMNETPSDFRNLFNGNNRKQILN